MQVRVAALEFHNDPRFGNTLIDLRDEDGNASETVILAGHNGCGKTTILEILFKAIANSTNMSQSQTFNVDIIYQSSSELPLFIENIIGRGQPLKPDQFVENREFAISVSEYPNGIRRRTTDGNWSRTGRFLSESIDVNVIYSDVNVLTQIPNIVTGIPFGQEHQVPTSVISGANLGKEISNYLVQIAIADANDLTNWVLANPGSVVPKDVTRVRLDRFAAAFAEIIPSKRLHGILHSDSGAKVAFTDFGKMIFFDQLSAGERQIVLRAAFVLRNLRSTGNTIILFDEPELSLHPDWQIQLVPYYKKIIGEKLTRYDQLIFATQSPFLIYGAPTAKTIFFEQNQNDGTVQINSNPSLSYIENTKIAANIFGLEAFVKDLRVNHVILIVEGSTDKKILECAWQKLNPHKEQPFKVRSADGAKNISRLLAPINNKTSALTHVVAENDGRIVALFDFDSEGVAQWNGMAPENQSSTLAFSEKQGLTRKRNDASVWAMLLPVPEFRSTYASLVLYTESKLTIELLFEDDYCFGYLEDVPVVGSSSITRKAIVSDSKKIAFASAVSSLPPKAFEEFRHVFSFIEAL